MSLWLRQFHPDAAGGTTLVCFPHAGGSATFFRPMASALRAVAPVVGVQYPGRQERLREALLPSIEALADGAYEALRSLGNRPLAFFGHSMGAAVAYEVAVRMHRAGRPDLVTLFVSGRTAPSRQRPSEDVHRRDDAGVLAEVRALGGTDAQVLDDADLREMVLPSIRGDYAALATYNPEPGRRVDCDIVVLVGDEDPKVDAGEAAAWGDHTTGSTRVLTFAGGHFYLVGKRDEVLLAIAAGLDADA
ncbi:MAG TPA: alpha/beta fold hydrolase [Actinoplanes sp.]|nr:alpha/beta fold hydrolase [Actinoplanes sp.]